MLHIYIVSLKQDVEKREVISNTLKELGLQFSFIDAIYGKELSEDVLNSIRAKSVGTVVPATSGEIGCTLSHIKVYQKLLKDNKKWACILEDDVILDRRFKVFVDNFNNDTMDPKDLYLMGGQSHPVNKYIIKSNKNTKYIGEQIFHKTIRSQYLVQRTCCYLISSYMANELLLLSKENFIIADDWGYLTKNKYINRIYLSDFVDHPTDISMSSLQKDREEAVLKQQLKRVSYIRKIKNTIKRHMRFKVLTAYKYIERKDKL